MKRQILIRDDGKFEQYAGQPIISNDVNAYEIVYSVNADLSGAIFKISALRSDGAVIEDIGSISGNTATYTMANNMYSVVGETQLMLSVLQGNSLLTSKKLTFIVEESFGEADISGDDRIPALTGLIIRTNDAATLAETQANYALTQGDYAREQGDYAKETADGISATNTETLTADKTLTTESESIQILSLTNNPMYEGNKNVLLPTPTGKKEFTIKNDSGELDSNYTIKVMFGATQIDNLSTGKSITVVWNGTKWVNKDSSGNLAVGKDATVYNGGAAFGTGASVSDGGVAFGNGASGTMGSVVIGNNASGSANATVIGNNAQATTAGTAIGDGSYAEYGGFAGGRNAKTGGGFAGGIMLER